MRKFKFNGELEVTDKISGGVRDLINTIYPVGISLEFSQNKNPNTEWPWQTWVEWGQGRVVVGAGTSPEDNNLNYVVGQTGGSKDAVVVSHNHSVKCYVYDSTWNESHYVYERGIIHYDHSGHEINWTKGGSNMEHVVLDFKAPDTGSSGVSGTNKNMQPYVVGKRWTRTA